MKYFAMWHGGMNYASPYVADDTMEFDSFDEMVQMCEHRYFNYDGSTPNVDDSSGMTVWLSDPRLTDDPYPDFMITRNRYGNFRKA